MEIRYIKNKNYSLSKPLFFSAILFLLPLLVSAQVEYAPLIADIPGASEGNFEDYLDAIYRLAISAAALMAVVKIIFGGVRYMLSDVVTEKSNAKDDIKGALLGLLIVLGAVLILNTINPQLTNFDLLNTNEFGLIGNKSSSLNVICTNSEGTSCEEAYKDKNICGEGETIKKENRRTANGKNVTTVDCISDGSEVIEESEYTDPEGTDIDQKKFDCEQKGGEWFEENENCRTEGVDYIPFPAEMTNTTDRRYFCSGKNMRYTTDGCETR